MNIGGIVSLCMPLLTIVHLKPIFAGSGSYPAIPNKNNHYKIDELKSKLFKILNQYFPINAHLVDTFEYKNETLHLSSVLM